MLNVLQFFVVIYLCHILSIHIQYKMYLPVVLFLLHASYGEKIQYKTLEEKLVCERRNICLCILQFPHSRFSRSSKENTVPNQIIFTKKGSKQNQTSWKLNFMKVKLPEGQSTWSSNSLEVKHPKVKLQGGVDPEGQRVKRLISNTLFQTEK